MKAPQSPARLPAVLLIAFFFITGAQAGLGQAACAEHLGRHVLYGNHTRTVYPDSANTSRVFLDTEGFLYPRQPVIDSQLAKYCGSLRRLMTADTALLHSLARGYGITTGTLTADTAFMRLQEKIAADIAGEINARAAGNTMISVLVHGFRKPFVNMNGDLSSVRDNHQLRQEILKHAGQSHYFVEVYWDGMYLPFWNVRRIPRMFEQESLPNAAAAGLGLRAITSRLITARLNVITHSLGARVAASLLFNSGDDPLRERSHSTPSHRRVDICLIAPAAGSKLFEKYYSRTTDIAYLVRDNYRLSVVFNCNDFALLKKKGGFGPGPYKYGVTTLGCNKDGDAFALYQMYRNSYPAFYYRVFNFTGAPKHALDWYDTQSQFKEVVQYIER